MTGTRGRVSLMVRRGLLAVLIAVAVLAGSSATPGAAQGSTPRITAINPTSAPAGSGPLPLMVDGGPFFPDSVIQLNTAPQPTTFRNPTQIATTVPNALLATPGTISVRVSNQGLLSNSVTFTVGQPSGGPLPGGRNPVPTILSLTPATVPVCSPTITLCIFGTNFVPGATGDLNDQPVTITFVTNTDLTAAIPGTLLLRPGTFPFTVINPPPGGGASAPVPFTVVARPPDGSPGSALCPAGPPPDVTPTPVGVTPTQNCPPATDVMGRLEPVQGVWQDDPFFEDRPGKQISRLGPTDAFAELPMVRGRPTLLFGVDRYAGERSLGTRNEIYIQGMTNWTQPVPVRFRFRLHDDSGGHEIWTSPVVGTVRLDGPCGPPQPFRVSLPVPNGAPTVGRPPFTFGAAGSYILTNELVREDGTPTGIAIDVLGTVRETRGPKTHFLPLFLNATNAAGRATAARL